MAGPTEAKATELMCRIAHCLGQDQTGPAPRLRFNTDGGPPLMSQKRHIIPNRNKKNRIPRQKAEDDSVTIGVFTFTGDFDSDFLAAIKSEMIAQHKSQETKTKKAKSKKQTKKRSTKRKKVVAALTEL